MKVYKLRAGVDLVVSGIQVDCYLGDILTEGQEELVLDAVKQAFEIAGNDRLPEFITSPAREFMNDMEAWMRQNCEEWRHYYGL